MKFPNCALKVSSLMAVILADCQDFNAEPWGACQTHNFELEWQIGVQFLDFLGVENNNFKLLIVFLWQFYFIFSLLCVKMNHTTKIQDNNEYKNPKKVWKWIKNELNCQNNNFSFNFLHAWTRKYKNVWRKTFNYGSKSAKIIFFCQIIESVENRGPIMGLQEKDIAAIWRSLVYMYIVHKFWRVFPWTCTFVHQSKWWYMYNPDYRMA